MPDSTTLGQLEMRVLGLFEVGEELSVRHLQQRLELADGRALAYTTVMTVLGRLYGKGVLERRREGAGFLYRPTAAAGQVKRGILSRVQGLLFQSERLAPVVSLLEDPGLSRDELKALRDAIDARLKGK